MAPHMDEDRRYADTRLKIARTVCETLDGGHTIATQRVSIRATVPEPRLRPGGKSVTRLPPCA